MGGRKQIHAYNPDEIDRLKGIPLPARLKCGRCRKNQPQAKFSIKQLTDARSQVKNINKIITPPVCHDCNSQQKVEIECTMCNKTKGLEEFAKSQRAKPDTARCFKCVEDQLNDTPVNEEMYEQPDAAFLPPDHSKGRYPEYWSSAASSTDTSSNYGEDEWNSINGSRAAQRNVSGSGDGGIALSDGFQRAMSINGSTDESLIETVYAFPARGENSNGDAWSQVRTKSWHTQSNAAPSGSVSSGFNPNAYRRSTTSVAGSSHSFASSLAERSVTSDIRPNGWAKIPAYKPQPEFQPCRPAGDTARETGSVNDAWDSDEEEVKYNSDDDDSDDDTVI